MYSAGFLIFCILAIVGHHITVGLYRWLKTRFIDLIAYLGLTIAIILYGAKQ